jgi:glycosyltransferase involved in cell wall biosynthesis
MRILIISQYFWPETFRITAVVQSLRAAGCDVTVLTGQPNYPDGVVLPGYSAASLRTQIQDGLTIHRVPLVPRGHGSAVRLALNYLSFVVSAAVFGSWLLRGQRVDVIFVYAPSPILQVIPAVWLKWVKGAKLVTWVQDLWPDSLSTTGFFRNPKILGAVAAVVRWIYRKNDLLLVQSQAFIEPVLLMAGRTPVIYHPNPGELALLKTTMDGPCPLKLEPGFNVVFAGNLGTVQALETLLDAAEILLPYFEIRLVLIGSGSRSAWLEKQVMHRQLKNVRLPGRFSPEVIPGILSQASVLLVSLKRSPIMSQTVPGKVQVYLASGRPIIAALDGEGARVVLESGGGLACPAEDATALAKAVLQLRATSSEELKRMGESGRRYYDENFDPAFLARQLMQRLDEVVNLSDNQSI